MNQKELLTLKEGVLTPVMQGFKEAHYLTKAIVGSVASVFSSFSSHSLDLDHRTGKNRQSLSGS